MKLKQFFLTLIFTSSPCVAHNVLGGVYVIGTHIEGEIGFSNGDMASLGSQVIVSDPQGNEIVSVKTDDEGFFSFEAARRVDHHIYADLGSGHVFQTVLNAEELPDTLGEILQFNSAVSAPKGRLQTDGLVGEELKRVVENAVAQQVIPLRKELNAYKEQASFRDVIGGIGYIFGLCGIGIWLTQKKEASKRGSIASEPRA